MSYGHMCAMSNIAGVYTRVSAYGPWLEQETGGGMLRPPELELEKRLFDKIAHNMYKKLTKTKITNNVLIVRRSLFWLQSKPLS